MQLKAIEICAGGGGQALGLEQAGFQHVALIENDSHACASLRLNRPEWPVIEADVRSFDASSCEGVDLLAGGVPCPPFSKAGRQLGDADDRDLFPEAIRLVEECSPRAVLLENVRGLLDPVFDQYRAKLVKRLARRGYNAEWRLLNASDFGVPQLRPRTVLVALREGETFRWPSRTDAPPPTVGEALGGLMAANGWRRAASWSRKANKIAPTLVGGSKKHGGPDLGPTRARQAWAVLGVDGRGLADSPPSKAFTGTPRLTVQMTAILQGFPETWIFAGGKTAAYRQIGNAFPPPVARVLGEAIRRALTIASGSQEESAIAA